MGFYNWKVVTFGAFLNATILGSIFTWGNLDVYVVGWLRGRGSPGLTAEQSSIVFTMIIVLFTLAQPIGSKLMMTIGGKWNMFIGSVIAVSGMFCSAFVQNIWEMSVTVTYNQYGIMLGAGTGMMYCYPLKCALDWDPSKKGIISGALLSGLGFGAFVWNTIATHYINPDDEEPGENGQKLSDDALNRVPYCFMMLAGIYAVILSIAHIFLIQEAPVRQSLIDDEITEEASTFSFKDTLKSKRFWLLWIMFVPLSAGGTLTSLVFREAGEYTGPSDSVLSLIGSIGMLLESTSQIVWGIVIDKTSAKFTATIISFLMCGALFLYIFMSMIHVSVFALWTIFILILYGGTIPTFVTLCGDNFGRKNASLVFAVLESCEGFAVILDYVFSAVLTPAMGLIWVYMIAGCLTGVSIAIVLLFRPVIFKVRYQDDENGDEKVKPQALHSLSTDFHSPNPSAY